MYLAIHGTTRSVYIHLHLPDVLDLYLYWDTASNRRVLRLLDYFNAWDARFPNNLRVRNLTLNTSIIGPSSDLKESVGVPGTAIRVLHFPVLNAVTDTPAYQDNRVASATGCRILYVNSVIRDLLTKVAVYEHGGSHGTVVVNFTHYILLAANTGRVRRVYTLLCGPVIAGALAGEGGVWVIRLVGAVPVAVLVWDTSDIAIFLGR